ncbi:LysR substrate-binding domain-containing protein [Aliivibrio kagoshimensis]|uniref:LysR substrate-binding domain-containing protein n=1 Tax=Aliivibrio kagoshimensis TaxID=2910230 RepID=UPI003D1516F4
MANWEGVSEFVSVAETESFTAAAKKLDTSVAQISRKVSALEDRLAIKLLNRTTRRVSVTEAGQTYYQHCRQVLDGLEQAERAVSNLQSTPQGKIKITAPVTYGEQQIAPLLNQFMEKHPQLELHFQLSNQQFDLVEQGFDLAIRLGRLHDSSMMAKRLSSRRIHVCASPDYIERYGEPYTLSELRQHNCLIGAKDYWRFIESGKERSIRIKGSIHSNSGKALTDAALKGIGIVQLPDYYVQSYLESGQLIDLLSAFQEEREGIWALYPNNRHLSPKVRMLVDFLAEKLA